MRTRWDGSRQSSNTPTYDKTGIPREDYAMYRCMVIGVLYVDDDQNISKNSKNPEVLYEVVILGGSAMGQTLSYCRLAAYMGGDLNYSERILRPSTKDISKVKLSDHDGDIVYVQFVQGHDAYPVIIGMAQGIHEKSGATKAQGPRSLESYNGFETLINNSGERITSMKAGSTSNGLFKANADSLITETWSKDGKLTVKTKGGVTTVIDNNANTISIKAGSTEILIDGASGKISLKGATVDLGNTVSDFVTKFSALASAFNSHTHMYDDAGFPNVTQPPLAPLLSSVGSQTVKVQD